MAANWEQDTFSVYKNRSKDKGEKSYFCHTVSKHFYLCIYRLYVRLLSIQNHKLSQI